VISGAAAAALLAAGAAPAGAATFPVTSNADAGANTLRAAIEAANGNGNTDVDQIPISVTGTIDLVSALPSISFPTTITGPGRANLTVRRTGATAFRVFDIAPNSPAYTIEIGDLTIADGQGPGSGGGVRALGAGTTILRSVALNGNSASLGGAVMNDGNFIRVLNSVINDNVATSNGAGIANLGAMTVRDSILTLNDSLGNAGAISTGSSPTHALLVANTTIANNTATGAGGGIGQFEGVVTLTSSTIAGNSANFDNAGGVGENGGGTASFASGEFGVVNTIYAGNQRGSGASATPDQCGGPLAHDSYGYNLRTSADAGCTGFAGPGDIVTASPLLGPIGEYGGPTRTIPLLAGSPAVDAGNPAAIGIPDTASCPATDQRGQPRGGPAGRCDIGAFELQATTPAGTSATKKKKCKKKKRKKGGKGKAAAKKKKSCKKRRKKR
jgi:hypothetical protein